MFYTGFFKRIMEFAHVGIILAPEQDAGDIVFCYRQDIVVFFDFFFAQEPKIYSKAQDLPPAKFNQDAKVRDSLIGSGTIINSVVEHSVIFKNVFIGNNTVIRNSIILNGAYSGDNVRVENCIVESNETLLSDTSYVGDDQIKIVIENNNRLGV